MPAFFLPVSGSLVITTGNVMKGTGQLMFSKIVLILSPIVLALFIIDPMLKRVTRWRSQAKAA